MNKTVKKKKSLKMVGLLLATSLVLVGCGSSSSESYSDMGSASTNSVSRDIMGVAEFEGVTGEYVVKEGSIGIDTVNYTEDKQQIESVITKYQAELQSINESTDQGYVPYDSREAPKTYYTTHYTIKVEAGKLNALMDDLGTIGHLTYKNLGSDDVTTQVTDLDSRVASLDAQIKRMNELYEQAETMEDILVIQERLDRAIAEKDTLLTEQESVSNQVKRSTVYVTLSEVAVLKDGVTLNESFTSRVTGAITRGWGQFKVVLQDTLVELVLNLPYIILIGLIALLAYVVNRVNKRKKGQSGKSTKSTNTTTSSKEE